MDPTNCAVMTAAAIPNVHQLSRCVPVLRIPLTAAAPPVSPYSVKDATKDAAVSASCP